MELPIYVLHGTWYTQDTDGAEVLGVSGDIAPRLKELGKIADTKARDYVEMSGQLQEERGDRRYEVVDGGWRYAKFHISEHQIAISEMAEGQIGREDRKKDGVQEMRLQCAAGEGQVAAEGIPILLPEMR